MQIDFQLIRIYLHLKNLFFLENTTTILYQRKIGLFFVPVLPSGKSMKISQNPHRTDTIISMEIRL